MIKNILRLENLAILLLAIYIYSINSDNWIIFIILFFVPDLSIIGYLKNHKTGAALYNLVHNYSPAIFIMGFGVLINEALIVSFGSILLAHVGMDRLLGFGLKENTGFKDTHLGKIGK